MKLLILLSLLSTLCFASKEQRRNDNILKCVSKMIKLQMKRGHKNLDSTVEVLEKLQKAQGSNTDLRNLKNECKRELRRHKKNAKFFNKPFSIDYYFRNHNPNVDQSIKSSMYYLASLKQECYLVGADASAAIYYSAGAGAYVGHCKRVDGKSYLVLIPKVSTGMGVGATATVSANRFSFYDGAYHGLRISLGAILAAEGDFSVNGGGGDGNIAFGVGAGAMLEAEYGAFINLLTLKYDFEKVKNELGIGE